MNAVLADKHEDEEDDDEGHKQVRKEMVEQFDSPWEGILTEWLVQEGSVVASARSDSNSFFLDEDFDL